jgi:uncharacterized protein
MKLRLRADLRVAMKEGRNGAANVLRSLVAAIDNAEAPPRRHSGAAQAPLDFHSGAAEVQRLLLNADQVADVLRAEIQERELAAADLERIGRPDRAQSLRAEARLAARYIADA